MNRRTFMLALGAAACGPKLATPPPRRDTRHDDPDHVTHHGEGMLSDRSFAQLLRCPLALQGDVLVRHQGDGLSFFDANTLAKTGEAAVSSYAFCFLRGGNLAAYVQPSASKKCEIHVVDETRAVRVYWGPEFARSVDTEIVPGRSPREVFVSDDNDDIVRFELRDDGEARATGRMKPDLSVWKRLRQLTSLGDGRVMTRRARGLAVQEPRKPDVEYPVTDEIIWHVASAGGSRIWYSYAVAASVNTVDGIALASVGDKLAVDVRVGFAPETVAHLASAGGAAVVLAAKPGQAAVVAIDEHGKQRWRAEVPTDFYAPDAYPDGAWVAMSDKRVVALANGKLLAWDAATGQRVG